MKETQTLRTRLQKVYDESKDLFAGQLCELIPADHLVRVDALQLTTATKARDTITSARPVRTAS